MTKREEYATYRAATPTTVEAAAGADMFFVITGSTTAGQRIQVRKIRVTGDTLTTLAVGGIVVEKWSTAPTGGTATALTQVPLNSAFPAGAANLCQVYTAAPTEGTLVGTVAVSRHILKSSTVVDGAPFSEVEFVFGDLDECSPVVLNDDTQALSLAFSAAPASAVTLSVEVEWTQKTGG